MADRLRKGMWVRSGNYSGIITNITDGTVTIDLTDDSGSTVGTSIAPSDAVAQMAYADIPEPRRPDEAMAKALGYL